MPGAERVRQRGEASAVQTLVRLLLADFKLDVHFAELFIVALENIADKCDHRGGENHRQGDDEFEDESVRVPLLFRF